MKNFSVRFEKVISRSWWKNAVCVNIFKSKMCYRVFFSRFLCCYWISLCFIRIPCCARFLARGKKEISIKFNNKAIEKRLLLHIFLSSWCGKKVQISKYVCIHSMYSWNLLLAIFSGVFIVMKKKFFKWKRSRERKTWNICFDWIKQSDQVFFAAFW